MVEVCKGGKGKEGKSKRLGSSLRARTALSVCVCGWRIVTGKNHHRLSEYES